jgi:ribosomal protein S18 acetylase RimI-like enzyme
MSWSLKPVMAETIDELMTWFPDAHSLNLWSGPRFRFPFDRISFHEDCCWKEFPSYYLRDVNNDFVAFGQLGARYGRSHLARLVTKPDMRGQGVGRQLLEEMVALARKEQNYAEVGLFVYKDNQPAYECYKAARFEIQAYPEGAPMPDKCYYMTRIL